MRNLAAIPDDAFVVLGKRGIESAHAPILNSPVIPDRLTGTAAKTLLASPNLLHRGRLTADVSRMLRLIEHENRRHRFAINQAIETKNVG